MLQHKLATLSAFTFVLLGGVPALAQPAAGPAHDHGAGAPAAHHMMGGSMGGHEDEDDCDAEGCPMHHGGMMGHGDGDDQPGMHMAMFEHMADELNLSDAVRKKIKDLLYDAKKQGITLHAELQQAQLELQRMLDQDKPDTDAALKQFDKVGQLKNELGKLKLRTMLEAQKQLTPEQRKKMREHMMKMGGHKH